MTWFLPGFLLPVPYPGDSGDKLKYYCMAEFFWQEDILADAGSMTFERIYFGG